jgi:hypothetical protein
MLMIAHTHNLLIVARLGFLESWNMRSEASRAAPASFFAGSVPLEKIETQVNCRASR